MPIELNVDIFTTIIKGVLIGIIASAPMGPVGILCVQRTLNKGRWYGFVTGIGAAVSDLIYAIITGLGMSFVLNFIQKPVTLFALKLSGSVILFFFGFYCFYNDPRKKKVHISGHRKGTLIYNGVTAFWITFLNPLIILLFVAAFAQFSFVKVDNIFLMIIGYISIISGALLWWFALTRLINKVRTKFDVKGIIIINKAIGSVVIIFSLIILLSTVLDFL
jgi:threonine/homoserine/homoserine lactone efflux protein